MQKTITIRKNEGHYKQKSSFKKILQFITIKRISYLSMILNSACIIFGISFLMNPQFSLVSEAFSIILFFNLFDNFLLVYIISSKVNKSNKKGHHINLTCYGYLVFSIIGMIGILGGNLLISSTHSVRIIDIFLARVLVFVFYFGILVFGILIAILGIKNSNNENLWTRGLKVYKLESERAYKLKRVSKRILTILSTLTYILSIFFAITIIFGSFEIITTFIAIIGGQFGIFFSLIFIANTIILLKIKGHRWTHRKYRIRAFIGIFSAATLFLPLLSTQFTIINADISFSNAFGRDWRDRIPSKTSNYFLEAPFSTMGYLLGTNNYDCKVKQHVLYHSNDEIQLYFDAYMPLGDIGSLPGQGSILIRIHGGAWIFGDKGIFSMMQMNKYFAAQGYVVFDIQYGLFDTLLTRLDPITPSYKKGNFNIDDMITHIGLFTKYISQHANDYGANIDSVFFSGGSAGGHLASAAALAMASGAYTDTFGNNLTVKGYIPFYPANGAMTFFGIGGSPEFLNPEMLVDINSPPCLIYQGTHDILNYFNIANNFRNTYLVNNNRECAILWMPFGGHASDFYFFGYYNQIFLYYMERFMYLYH